VEPVPETGSRNPKVSSTNPPVLRGGLQPDLCVCVCVCVWLDIFMKRLLIEHRFLLITGSVQAQQPLGALTAC
jgi:hypothetical protein